ncbi:GltB/FmdC/FwdC-like GXGXG domain-containing protein [Tautonia sociabilis]|uniref:GltB/FmdC/FwdC-like GXGXG domain-containing protein n=1 Tax=Tautonia sociabilis TaxID=2080755 RepID=UPI0013151E93|nr:glutamate synthase [Tautonia sociabilis]
MPSPPSPPAFEIPVALVRDYRRINLELSRALDDGRTLVRLVDVEGQRLLASGLHGDWRAVVEVVGNAGPELAAGLNAPGLTIRCTGSAADGAARGLVSGRVAIRGQAGDAVAAAMLGGTVVVAGGAGHRAGLRMRGGTLVLFGPVGRLLADRRAGGLIFADPSAMQRPSGRPGDGGRLLPLPQETGHAALLDPEDARAYRDALHDLPDGFRSPRSPV